MTKPVQTRTVTLSNPLEIDGEKVTEITLRKPKAGELRGLNMVNILQMDITTMFKLLPRITRPPVSEQQLSAEVETEDFTQLAGQTVAFFRPSRSASDAGLKLPEDVEEAMADIASIFHWPPDVMDKMSIEELARWREKARARAEVDPGVLNQLTGMANGGR